MARAVRSTELDLARLPKAARAHAEKALASGRDVVSAPSRRRAGTKSRKPLQPSWRGIRTNLGTKWHDARWSRGTPRPRVRVRASAGREKSASIKMGEDDEEKDESGEKADD